MEVARCLVNITLFFCCILILTRPYRYGSPPVPLPRKTIGRGINKNIISIELFPPKFHIYRLTKDEADATSSLLEPATVALSAHDMLQDLCTASIEAVRTETTTNLSARVWHLTDPNFNHSTRDLPVPKLTGAQILKSDTSSTLEEATLESGDSFVVEFQDPVTHEWLLKKEADAPAEPLFKSNDGFFNRMSTSTSSLFSGSNSTAEPNGNAKAAVDKKLSVIAKKEKVKEKERWNEPGTLGLGNM